MIIVLWSDGQRSTNTGRHTFHGIKAVPPASGELVDGAYKDCILQYIS